MAAVEAGGPGGHRRPRHRRRTCSASCPSSTCCDEVAARFGAETRRARASAVELALEGLYLARRIAKDPDDDGQLVYSG